MAPGVLRGGRGKKLVVLACVLRRHPDKLRADFQQYYGLNLDGMGCDYSVDHAAALAANLPPESRCGIASNPLNAWTPQMCLLALIEHRLNIWNWWHTDDGRAGTNKPEILVPFERADEADPYAPVAMGVDEMMDFVGGLVGAKGGEDGE